MSEEYYSIRLQFSKKAFDELKQLRKMTKKSTCVDTIEFALKFTYGILRELGENGKLIVEKNGKQYVIEF